MDEILLVDKPAGWTSFDVVAKVRGALRARFEIRNSQRPWAQPKGKFEIESLKKIRVGHAGTLDPFATGLLIILIGAATKRQDSYMKLDKEYEATLVLGSRSDTGDPEGHISKTPKKEYQVPSEPRISKVLKQYLGQIEQIPPQYSAIKVSGKPAYKYARQGKEVALRPRTIEIYKIDLLKYHFPELQIRVSCSSGTYIRTLAQDIGNWLGCGAYLQELRRTKIGDFDLKEAKRLEEALKDL